VSEEKTKGLRAQQRSQLDARILAAAWELLTGRSFDQWTLHELADRVGVSRRTLYHHFPSKEAIGAATLAGHVDALAAEIDTVAPHSDPGSRLRAVILWSVGLRQQPKPGPIGSLKSEPGLMALVKTFPVYQAADGRLHDKFAAIVLAAQASGQVTERWPAAMVARLIIDWARSFDPEAWASGAAEASAALVDLLFLGLGPDQEAKGGPLV
jgi:AcrR family transcriptional regulator